MAVAHRDKKEHTQAGPELAGHGNGAGLRGRESERPGDFGQ
jgi:hypothetical protein